MTVSLEGELTLDNSVKFYPKVCKTVSLYNNGCWIRGDYGDEAATEFWELVSMCGRHINPEVVYCIRRHIETSYVNTGMTRKELERSVQTRLAFWD